MPHPNPEFRSLDSTRDCLRASIADRKRLEKPTDGHVRVTKQEEGRLAEVEARMKEIDAKAFAELLKEAAKPEPTAPAQS